MRILSRILIALLVAGMAATAPTSAAELTPHTARYDVRIKLISGRLDTELRTTTDGYFARHVIRATGLSRIFTGGRMDFSSEFRAGPDGLAPVWYHAVDTIRDDPETRIRFDWDTNEAAGTFGNEEVLVELDGIAYDKVSIQYELMHDLLNGGTGETYVLFDVEKLRVAHVTRVGQKSVATQAGVFDVVGVRHQREGSSRATTFWFAPQLDYLPVIIEQHRKGKLNFRASLTEYTTP